MLTTRPAKKRNEVLLVDDNPADIDLTREILTACKQRCHVNSVSGGDEAILFLRREGPYRGAPRPDVVILDLDLPGKDGRAVLRKLKSDTRLSKIPVVIFTTSDASSDVATSYELGANCYLRKPGTLSEYRAVVESLADFWLGAAILSQ